MLDFQRLAAANGIPTLPTGHHHCSPGWVQTHCPFCGRGKGDGWHLGWSLSRGSFACWKCGGLKFWDVMRAILGDRANAEVAKYQIGDGPVRIIKPPPITRPRRLKPPPCTGPMEDVHRQYLRSRGFHARRLEETWGLMGTKASPGGWGWRIVIPIANQDGRVVAYQGRSVGPAEPRYKMLDNRLCVEDPSTLLYGIDRVHGDAVIVVEGAPSVWRMGEGTVATMGTGWKPSQADRLRQFKRRYILFDPEPDAQRRAQKLAHHLSLFGGVTEVLTGFTTDPGDFSEKLAAKIRRELSI